MSPKTPIKSICVAIPADLHQAGKELARQEDISFSALARRALRKHLKLQPSKNNGQEVGK